MIMSVNQDLFYNAAKAAFDNWTAFQLALTHNFAGNKTREIAEWFLDATVQYIKENDDLEDFELEEFFEDTMNTEFNSILEDGSAIQLARLLLNYKKMVNKNQLTELKEDLQKRFPTKSNTVASSIKFKEPNQPEDDTSSSGTDDEDESDMNNNVMNSDEMKNKKNQLTEKETEDFQMMDEGWTFVAKSGKHLTK